MADEPTDADKLPVTIVTGFLGAGKTTLLKHILENSSGHKIATVVNDVAALNVDANLVRNARVSSTGGGTTIEMQNGCVCCTLRSDLVVAIAELATSGAFDAIVIEASGVSEPEQIAETFVADITPESASPSSAADRRAMRDMLRALKGATSLGQVARLDAIVTVVSAAAFAGDLATPSELVERFGRERDGGEVSVACALEGFPRWGAHGYCGRRQDTCVRAWWCASILPAVRAAGG